MKIKIFFVFIMVAVIGIFDWREYVSAQEITQDTPTQIPIRDVSALKDDDKNNFKEWCVYKLTATTENNAQTECFNKNAPSNTSPGKQRYKEVWKLTTGEFYCCLPEHPTDVKTDVGTVTVGGQTAEQRLTATQQDWRKKYPGLYESTQPALERGLNLDWPNSPITNVNLKQLERGKELTGLVKYLYGWGISLGGLAAFIALVIAGFQYLTSAGNAQKMSDAISRIRSAAIGLVLLLASVLILNTINPQLTTLKMPPLTIGTEQIPILPTKIEGIAAENCLGATLFSGTNFTNPISGGELASGGQWDPGETVNVRSVDIKGKGLCQLKLYQEAGYLESADMPAATISSDTLDILTVSNTTKFRSGRLINLFYPEMLKNQ